MLGIAQHGMTAGNPNNNVMRSFHLGDTNMVGGSAQMGTNTQSWDGCGKGG